MSKISLMFLLSFVFILLGCKKEPNAPNLKKINIDTSLVTTGIYVLNEGLMNMNNASLTYYSFNDSIPQTDYFNRVNGRKLGDTGNDMAVYGNRLYIVMCISSQLEVIELSSGKSIKRIPIFNGDKARQPRRIAFYKNKALVCSFDGTVAIIDTGSLEIEKYITVGRNPDAIAVVNNKAYVSNSGGLDAPNYDNTVSVIDLQYFVETKKINVQINPYNMASDDYGDLYVISRGDYDKKKMCLQIIDTKFDELKYTFPDFEALNLVINGDTAYVYYFDFSTGSGSKILLLNVKTETMINDNFINDGTKIQTAFGISVDKISTDVFITDAKGFVNTGEVICFGNNGHKKYSFKAGLNPGKVAFLNSLKIDTAQTTTHFINELTN